MVSISLVFALIIGFIYTNNVTLSMTPERWHPKYYANPAGWNLNFDERTIIPRFLHFFFAALAVGGVFISLRGILKRGKDPDYGRYMIGFGGKAFMYATMIQFVIGIWFFASLPRALRMLFMGDSLPATIVLSLGILGAVAAIMLISGALREQDPKLGLYSGMGITALVVAFMVVSRDMLRDAYLQPYLRTMSVQTQWGVFPLFLVLFLSGLCLWLIMMKRYQFLRSAFVEKPESMRDPER